MNINEIRQSGLLEYYVLGLLSDQEVQTVEGYLVQYPQLQDDYLEIQKALQVYAKSLGISPKLNFEQDILDAIRNKGSKIPIDTKSKINTPILNDKSVSGLDWKSLAIPALLAASLFFSWYGYNKGVEYTTLLDEYNTYKVNCESEQEEATNKKIIYANISVPNNRTLKLTPTDGYQKANLLFHNNEVDKRNYIQVINLPQIADNHAFQLWSLKDGVDPIPLTVFKGSDDLIFPVDFEEGTGTYAITIELEAGARVPTLTRLIGTIAV